MEINNFILLLLSLSLSLVSILGFVESFDYHEKELESEQGLQGMYKRWQSHHKVSGKGPERFNVFKSNVELVHSTNKLNRPYKLQLNKFADLTTHEITSTYGNSKISHYLQLRGKHTQNLTSFMYKDATDLPPRIDWREKNAVNPVKNQQGCGSCYAFSAVAAVEGINAIRTGKLLVLSEQQLVDCDTKGNDGCDGGWMAPAFDYIKEHGGLATEEYYPYVHVQQPCKTEKFGHHSVTLDGGENVPPDGESVMKALANQPLAFTMDTSAPEFGFYSSGVYTGPCDAHKADHAMALVGYDETPEGMKYWIVRNSWGPDWGEKGYLRIQRGVKEPEGLCGINQLCTYPLKSPDTRNVEL